jgi:hypothetical protein
MATVAPTTAGRVDVVEWPKPHEQLSAVCAADITAGTFVRQTTTGRWIVALATSTTNSAGIYFAPRSAKTGETLTGMKAGVFGGFTVSQAFNASLYLSDTGTLADAAGTTSVVVGRVIHGTANQVADAHDKLVRIECPN